MENINCVGCKNAWVNDFSCAHYCAITKDWLHIVDIKNAMNSPIVPDNGFCPGYEREAISVE